MVLGDKYRYYLREVRKMKGDESITNDNVTYLTSENIKKTPEGIVLDNLRLNKKSSRRHILTHVDIE